MSVSSQISRLTGLRDEFREILKEYDLVDDTADLEACVDALDLFFTQVKTTTGYQYGSKLLESSGSKLKTSDGKTLLGDFTIIRL